jgi:hypothetical protein
MRYLLFDELNNNEINKIKTYLINKTEIGSIENIYWLLLPEEILTKQQTNLLNQFGPFKIAIEIGKTWIKFELLIRSSSIDNIGGCLANSKQFEYIYNFSNTLVETLNLITCT